MKTLYGLIIIVAVVALAVWGLPKLLTSQSPAAAGTASAAAIKQAATEAAATVKQATSDAVDYQTAAEKELYGQDIPWWGYTPLGWPIIAGEMAYDSFFGDEES